MYYLLNLIKFSVKKTITEKNTGKWEKILEKSGNSVSPEKWEPCFSEWYRHTCLLNLIKFSVKKTITEKNTGKWEKILEKSGNSVSPEKWEPCFSEW